MRILQVVQATLDQPGMSSARSPCYRVVCDTPLRGKDGIYTDDGVMLDRVLATQPRPKMRIQRSSEWSRRANQRTQLRPRCNAFSASDLPHAR